MRLKHAWRGMSIYRFGALIGKCKRRLAAQVEHDLGSVSLVEGLNKVTAA